MTDAWVIQITISNRHASIDVSSVYRQFPNCRRWKVLIIHPDPDNSSFNYPTINPSNASAAQEGIASGAQNISRTSRFVTKYQGFFTYTSLSEH